MRRVHFVFWRLWRVGSVCCEVLEALKALKVLEVMRCVLLCTLEAVVGELSFVSIFPLWQFSRYSAPMLSTSLADENARIWLQDPLQVVHEADHRSKSARLVIGRLCVLRADRSDRYD